VLLPLVQAFGRRLFRLLKRALSSWPEQRPVEAVFSLWLALLAPWHPPDPPGTCHLHPEPLKLCLVVITSHATAASSSHG
jgi:hypothetical protein